MSAPPLSEPSLPWSARTPAEAVQFLKTAYTPAMFPDLTDVFVRELQRLQTMKENLTLFVSALLLEFKAQALNPGYSKCLLTALTHAFPHAELKNVLNCSDFLRFLCENYTKIDGKSANFLAKTIVKEEVIMRKQTDPGWFLSFALNLWRSKNSSEAVRFAILFSLESDLLASIPTSEGVFSRLISEGNAELAVQLAGDSRDRIIALVPYLSSKENLKIAGRLIRENELEKTLFPEICGNIRRNAVWYYLNSEEVKLWRLAEILEEDMEMMGMLIDAMLTSRKAPAIRQLASELLSRYPSLRGRLRGKARDALRLTPPAATSLIPEDLFAPYNPKALQLPIGVDKVRLVCEERDLERVELEAGDVVGFDCEWLPPLISINDSPVSLFQIATRTDVYLLDMHRLRDSRVLDAKLVSLFANPRIIKVGMSFDGDLKKLRKSCPTFQAFSMSVCSFADLHIIKKAFADMKKGGLADICKRFLGKVLCKEEQVSNWNKRPLRLRQMHYAALDSYCEILVWDSMLEERGATQPTLSSLLADLSAKPTHSD